MVLLAVLHELAGARGWKLFVAHYNHQLRGRASAGDERFVQQAAARLGLPFQAGCGNVKAIAKQLGISLEMAARQCRHEFLAQTAHQLKCSAVAMAHHADDQVELFFLRLLRGAGGEGLAGMKWDSPSPVSGRVRLVRPLLDISKAALAEFARRHELKFRADQTNASSEILRNRVRHELLPMLRTDFQPGLSPIVLRLMELVGAEAEVVEAMATDWLTEFPHGLPWERLAVGIQRRIIQQQLQRLKVAGNFELVEWLRLWPGKAVSLAQDRFAIRTPNGSVCIRSGARISHNSRKELVNLSAAESVSFGELDLTWNLARRRGAGWPKPVENREVFDADLVGHKVFLRHWAPGDRFQPIGMKAAVKLQDWFTNLKIPAAQRRSLVLATTSQGEVFWVQGLRIGERFKITEVTRNTLTWRWFVRNPPEVLHCGDIHPMLGFAR